MIDDMNDNASKIELPPVTNYDMPGDLVRQNYVVPEGPTIVAPVTIPYDNSEKKRIPMDLRP